MRTLFCKSGFAACLSPGLPFFLVGQDEPSSLEVTWPDGRFISRTVAKSETNSVLEIPYPQDTKGSPSIALPLEVSLIFYLNLEHNSCFPTQISMAGSSVMEGIRVSGQHTHV